MSTSEIQGLVRRRGWPDNHQNSVVRTYGYTHPSLSDRKLTSYPKVPFGLELQQYLIKYCVTSVHGLGVETT